MKSLIFPPKLKVGDRIATISLSWGGAGDQDISWRYEQGKRQMEEVFGFELVEMTNTLKGTDYLYQHPQARAADLMQAFSDPSIKGIVTCIGGIDSIRILPYIDFDVIRDNPKLLLGYSDTTISHMICYKAGLSSVYGPTLLVDFAENNGMDAYTVAGLKAVVFDEGPLGRIDPAKEWTSEFLPWQVKHQNTSRQRQANKGYECLQGSGRVKGHLIGGCIEVFDELRGTSLFPALEDFVGAILFFETSEEKPPAWLLETILRTYGIMGILDRIHGMIWGKPVDEVNYEAYNATIKKVLAEFGQEALPVLVNVNFGHTEPKISLPYGRMIEIDCQGPFLIGV